MRCFVWHVFPPFSSANGAYVCMANAESRCDISLRSICPPNSTNKIVRDLDMDTPPTIDYPGYRLEMSRIYASGLPTEMVDLETLWDRPDLLFVHRAVGQKLMPSELNARISQGMRWRLFPDPAWSCIAAVFFSPEIGRDGLAAFQVSDVTANEPQVFPRHMAMLRVRHGGSWCLTTAAALTDTGWIRGREIVTRTFSPMAAKIRLRIALALRTSRLIVDACILSTTAPAEHGRIVAKA